MEAEEVRDQTPRETMGWSRWTPTGEAWYQRLCQETRVDFSIAPEPLEPLVPDLLCFGARAMLAADEGYGKSLFVAHLAFSVANGLAGCARGGVLVLDGQNGRRRLMDRYRRMAAGFLPPSHPGFRYPAVNDLIGRCPDLTTAPGAEVLRSLADAAEEDLGSLALVVIDARDDFIGARDVNEIDTANRFWETINEFLASFERPPAMLVCTNLRKVQAGDYSGQANFVTQRVSGHKRWTDLPDIVLGINAYRSRGRRHLDVITVWPAKDRDDYVKNHNFKFCDGPYSLALSPSDEDPSEKYKRPKAKELAYRAILEEAESANDWVPWPDFLRKHELNENAAREARIRLEQEGRIEVWKERGKKSQFRLKRT